MYPDTVNLPFNGAILRKDFTPALPGTPDPGDAGYWLILQGGALVVDTGEGKPALPEGDLPEQLSDSGHSFYLGQWLGKPLRVLALDRTVPLPHRFAAEPFNAVSDILDDKMLTLGGMAQQILYWQRQSSCCSRCGGELQQIPAGWGKKCRTCAHEHYPHIHPCVIVLVKRGEEFLLARKPGWPQGRYSLVAGFLDIGESLEECVHREVLEETGLRVANLRYVGSQNWPFPSQVMAGFLADYAGGEIHVDTTELEDARWFSPASLPTSLPSVRSIARWIIDNHAIKTV
jgi:NAD+ diphosphatase